MKNLFLFTFLLFCHIAHAQLGNLKDRVKDKAKDKADRTARNAVQGQKNKFLGDLQKKRAEMDSANYTCAIAVSDNTGFYEENQRWNKMFNSMGQDFIADGRLNLNATSKITSNITDPAEYAQTRMELGESMLAMNKYKAAEKNFSVAEENFKKAGKTNDMYYAKLMTDMGLMYSALGNFEKAENYLEQALQIRKQLFTEQSNDYAIALNNKAVLYNQQGHFTDAQNTVNQAIQIAEVKNLDKSILAIMYNNKAYFQQVIGQNQKALEFYETALKMVDDEKSQKSLTYQRVVVNKALLLQEMGKKEDALAIYEKVLKVKKGQFGTNSPDYAHLLNLTASLYMQMGEYKKVESYLQDAYSIYKKKFGDNHPSTAKTLHNLGLYYLYQGNPIKAEENLKKSYEARKQVLGENHPDFNASQEGLALLYWQQGKIKEASEYYKKVLDKNNEFIVKYFPAMNEAEKDQYWSKLRPTYMRFYSFATQNGEKEPQLLSEMYNAHISTKGILLNATSKIKQRILSSKDEQLIKDYNLWIEKKEQLARLYSLSKEELKEQEIDLGKLESEANDLERALSQKSEIFKSKIDDKLHTIKEIDAALTNDEAALEIITFQNFDKKFTGENVYVALVAGKHQHNHPKMAILGKGKAFEEDELKYYQNVVRARRENKVSYGVFWEKIEPLLQGKKRIFVSLDGVYNQISLNTLRKPNGKFVVEDWNLTFVTNTRFVPDAKEREKKPATKNTKKALLVGFPNYGNKGTISPLPGTKKEVENISPILKTLGYKIETYLADNANETNVKKADDAVHPDIIHIATHGYFINEIEKEGGLVFGVESSKAKSNPMLRSGLVFAGAEETLEGAKNNKDYQSTDNGFLTAYEVANMNLDNSELAILSACETGLGDVKAGEGVYGLQRAFQIAGVDATVMSLWKVSDDATQELMTLFYNNLKVSKNKPDAFRKAQLKLKEKYKDPYFWGAFILTEN
ncbi:MAG: CHAT domain-containing protein [Raineya sp.]|jgi:CHAT domain-containing protein/Tfp pilus assembly protein PilF|nr:CHAT domain-containing protein [Raineya sp.]